VLGQHQHLLIFQLAIVPILNLVTLSLLKDKEMTNQTCLTVNQLKMKKKTIVSIKKHQKEAWSSDVYRWHMSGIYSLHPLPLLNLTKNPNSEQILNQKTYLRAIKLSTWHPTHGLNLSNTVPQKLTTRKLKLGYKNGETQFIKNGSYLHTVLFLNNIFSWSLGTGTGIVLIVTNKTVQNRTLHPVPYTLTRIIKY
jgi:hypothetical protein